MRIVDIREISVPLQGQISNSLVNFSSHNVSMVAVLTDVIRNGRPVSGVAFNSIGRFAQPGLLRERFMPRVLAAAPHTLLAADEKSFDAAAVAKAAMSNEKPGGHGDRAAAMGALELAIWDLNAKLVDEPAHRTIARVADKSPLTGAVPVYAAGGYYYPGDSLGRLREELASYKELGFTAFKIKIGGASLEEDLERIHAAIEIAGSGANIAVDANGRFDFATAIRYAEAVAPLKLRWYEEIGDPLDFALNSEISERYSGPIATGENLFSTIDAVNLMRFGGMRQGLDIFQMDAGLSYGLTEYINTMNELEQHGFSRQQVFPHGGHLINLHIVAGLGLGGCEVYPGVFQPFGGYPQQCMSAPGFAQPTDAPGFGLEEKAGLRELVLQITKQ